jgi:hypothetical protein|tara:strand:+ start:242 stop:550 length:309 start_codon:yes stop_codon:yes gene_type:complete
MDEHVNLLRGLIKNGPIERVDGSLGPPVAIVKELVNEGLVKAIDASSFDGPSYLGVEITMYGRTWLEDREGQEDIVDLKPSFMGMAVNLNAAWRKFLKLLGK